MASKKGIRRMYGRRGASCRVPALVLSAAVLLVGCGDLQNVTAGHIGCAPGDITISDESTGWNSASWVATCHGKTYFCSGAGKGNVSCKEAESG